MGSGIPPENIIKKEEALHALGNSLQIMRAGIELFLAEHADAPSETRELLLRELAEIERMAAAMRSLR